jgi:hypothetical protein
VFSFPIIGILPGAPKERKVKVAGFPVMTSWRYPYAIPEYTNPVALRKALPTSAIFF